MHYLNTPDSENINETIYIDLLNLKAFEHREANPQNSLDDARRALSLSDKLYYSEGRVKALINIAWSNFYLNNYSDSIRYSYDAITFIKKNEDKADYASILSVLGHTYRKNGNFELSLKYYFDVLKIYEQLEDKYNTAYINRSIAIVYTLLKQTNIALEYGLKALNTANEINDEKLLASVTLAIGDIYNVSNDKEKGIQYNTKALELYQKFDDKMGASYACVNLGNIYEKAYFIEKAVSCYDNALENCISINDNFGMAHIYLYKAKLYMTIKMFRDGENALKQGIELVEKLGITFLKPDFYKLYSDFYVQNLNYIKGYEYYVLYSEASHLNISQKNQEKIIQLQYEYDMYLKEKQIELYRLKSVELAQANSELEQANAKIIQQNNELTILSKKLEELSKIDELTKVYNRRGIKDKITAIQDTNSIDSPYYIVVCDLDNFKEVNDTYGHPFGDYIIEECANILKQHASENDYICRWGGEEFLILLQSSIEDCILRTEAIRKAIAAFSFKCGAIRIPITMTFGISEFLGPNIAICLSKADKAMYHGKKKGRNCIVHIKSNNKYEIIKTAHK